MADDTTQSTPTRLGRYDVVRRLGAGGMAEVFLAKSTGAEGIEKVLVVKRILPTFARSAKFITMFLEEAKIATRLNHPNIVQVYAFEQVRDEFLLAMEYVDGLDLGRLVSASRRSKVPLPWGVCAFAAMEVAKGLDYAHKRKDERGEPMEIVHRDVSPQNVLLSYEGGVKVADFGIAKARMVSEETGVIKGKFSYMSPEQARGERVDPRCDVYALGILLAELLMGRAMYPGQHGLDVLEKVRKGEITYPEQVDPDVPEDLCAIVHKATAYDRDDRYQSARALASALGRWLHQQDEVYDHERLERFIADISPREVTSPDARRGAERSVQTAATVASAIAGIDRETRERRHVVVIAGRIRGGAVAGDGDAGTGGDPGAEVKSVLENIAFKADAVLTWPEGSGRKRFRLMLGLRRATVHDPLTAMRLGLDVLEALHGLSADLATPLTATMGVSRGVVSTVRDAAGRLLRYEPVGAFLEVAERLVEAGDRGQVLAAGEVYRLARRTFAFDEERPRSVEVTAGDGGGPRALRAYRLRGALTREERAAEALATPASGSLIGRSEELRAFQEAYQEAVAGKRSVYLALSGELGMGKTFLGAAAIDGLDPPPLVLHAECGFGSADVPFATASELFREALGIAEDETPAAARERLRATATELLPADQARSLIESLGPIVAQGGRDEQPDAFEGNRSRAIARAARILVGAIAQQGPLVLWVDALQWADTPSLELMAAMVRDAYDAPILVVFSTRPDPRAEKVLSAIPHIELGELDEDERRALIGAKFGGAAVPADVVDAIVERAGGNPFFITELVEALMDRGAVSIEGEGEERRVVRKPGVAIALPTTLEGVIAARLDELPEQERRAIRWLAAAGPGHSASELGDLAQEDVAEALCALEERGLLQRGGGQAYGFPSAVIRHVAYETTDEDDRVRMHARIGAWLSQAPLAAPPARIARHLERAGDRAAAAQAYLRAASAARAVYSNREALRFYARALSLLAPDSPHRFYAHEAREQILRGLGRPIERMMELEAMRALAERSEEPELVALAYNRLARHELDHVRTTGVGQNLELALAAATRARDRGAEVEALRLGATLAQEEGDIDRALDACDRALARCGIDRELLAARGSVLVQRATLLRRASRLEEALEANAEAIVIFRRLGIKRNEAMALNALGVALYSMGEYEDSMTCIRASIALDREIGDRMHLGRKLSNVGQLYAELGDPTHALEFLAHAERVFDAVDDDAHKADLLCALAEVLLESGRATDEAAAKLDQARRISDRTGDLYDIAHERLVRVALETATGRLSEAAKAASEGVEVAEDAGVEVFEIQARASLALARARLGDEAGARESIAAVGDLLAGREHVERAERVHLSLALALEALGDAGGAGAAYARARSVVTARLDRIHDEGLRDRYLSMPIVRAIREAQPGAGPERGPAPA